MRKTFIVGDGSTETVNSVVSRMFWLAWQSCKMPFGMGILQDNPGANEAEVMKNVIGAGDYTSNLNRREDEVYGDYVFGRMMKLGVTFDTKEGKIGIPTSSTDIEYQGWSGQYPTYQSLFDAAIESLGIEAVAA